MLKKSLLLSILLVSLTAILVISGCDNRKNFFIISGLTVAPYTYEIDEFLYEDSSVLSVDSISDSAEYAYSDIVWLTSPHISYASRQPSLGELMFTHSHAFSPGPNIYTHIEKLVDIRIYTLHDYNADYKAGDRIDEIVQYFNTDKEKYIEFNALYEGYPGIESLPFTLTAPPSILTTAEFRVEFIFDNDKTIHTISLPVKIY